MSGKHFISLKKEGKTQQFPGGTRIQADANNLPVLKRMSLYYLELDPQGVREPHWHVNANELAYCLEGSAIFSILGTNSQKERFQISAGELAFVPQGFLHSIENSGTGPARFAIVFNHELPHELGLSGSTAALPHNLLAATFGTDEKIWDFLPSGHENIVITQKDNEAPANISKWDTNKFKLSGIDPQADLKWGKVAKARKEFFPILNGLTCYDLKLKVGGLREPHWHPNAAELDYVVSGRARMMILSPEGSLDTFEVSKGDVVFIPAAYFHYIENIGEEDLHFAIFFDSEIPQDIGISGSLGFYSNQMLASLYQVDPALLEKLPKPQESCLIAPQAVKPTNK